MENCIRVFDTGRIFFQEKVYLCALGKNGVTTQKKEGDGATPLGCFSIRRVWYRADRLEKPETVLETRGINENDGWCDNPKDEKYNQHITLPHEGSYENLWREDFMYDIVVVLGYNDDPVVPGNGSAIFMHSAREDYSPTLGCIALAKEDLLGILKKVDRDTQVCVSAE